MEKKESAPVTLVEGRCRICDARTGIVRVTEFNLKVCPSCYLRFFERRVRRSLEKESMILEGDRVAVAVSGGKDSAALLFTLKRLSVVMGFELQALHFHLNMGDYSDRNLLVVEEQAGRAGVPLRVVRLDDLGLRVQRVKGWNPCAVCGAIKRSLFNREAGRMGATVVATAHTLEDLLLFTFKNLLSRKYYTPPPLLPPSDGLLRKVKPLAFIPERLNLVYCHLRDIPVFGEKCPYWTPHGHSLKAVFEQMEKAVPSSKLQLFLSLREVLPSGDTPLSGPRSPCSRCGEPSSQPLCTVCRLRDHFAGRGDTPDLSDA